MNVEINEVQSAPSNLLLPLFLAPWESPLPTLAEIQIHAPRALEGRCSFPPITPLTYNEVREAARPLLLMERQHLSMLEFR